MQFASVGAVVQQSLMARARKRCFIFDNTVTPEAALTDPVTWMKSLVDARSVAYNISDGKMQGTQCSGFLSQVFYPAHMARHYPFYRDVNSYTQFTMSDTLTQEQRALKFGVMSNIPAALTSQLFSHPLVGPVSLSNNDVFDSYTPKYLPGVQMQTVLVPRTLGSKGTNVRMVPDATATYSSSGSTSNTSYSYAYQMGAHRFNTELNTYVQNSVAFNSSTKGTAIAAASATPPAGMLFGYTVQYYYYNPLSGTTTSNYTYSLPGGNNNVALQHPAMYNFAAANQSDSAAFDFKWAGCPVWNGQKIVCEIFRVGTDLTQNAQGQTNVQPDLTFNVTTTSAIKSLISM